MEVGWNLTNKVGGRSVPEKRISLMDEAQGKKRLGRRQGIMICAVVWKEKAS